MCSTKALFRPPARVLQKHWSSRTAGRHVLKKRYGDEPYPTNVSSVFAAATNSSNEQPALTCASACAAGTLESLRMSLTVFHAMHACTTAVQPAALPKHTRHSSRGCHQEQHSTGHRSHTCASELHMAIFCTIFRSVRASLRQSVALFLHSSMDAAPPCDGWRRRSEVPPPPPIKHEALLLSSRAAKPTNAHESCLQCEEHHSSKPGCCASP